MIIIIHGLLCYSFISNINNEFSWNLQSFYDEYFINFCIYFAKAVCLCVVISSLLVIITMTNVSTRNQFVIVTILRDKMVEQCLRFSQSNS